VENNEVKEIKGFTNFFFYSHFIGPFSKEKEAQDWCRQEFKFLTTDPNIWDALISATLSSYESTHQFGKGKEMQTGNSDTSSAPSEGGIWLLAPPARTRGNSESELLASCRHMGIHPHQSMSYPLEVHICNYVNDAFEG